jgi:hypothetical protein
MSAVHKCYQTQEEQRRRHPHNTSSSISLPYVITAVVNRTHHAVTTSYRTVSYAKKVSTYGMKKNHCRTRHQYRHIYTHHIRHVINTPATTITEQEQVTRHRTRSSPVINGHVTHHHQKCSQQLKTPRKYHYIIYMFHILKNTIWHIRHISSHIVTTTDITQTLLYIIFVNKWIWRVILSFSLHFIIINELLGEYHFNIDTNTAITAMCVRVSLALPSAAQSPSRRHSNTVARQRCCIIVITLHRTMGECSHITPSSTRITIRLAHFATFNCSSVIAITAARTMLLAFVVMVYHLTRFIIRTWYRRTVGR